jgi:hypothetical protein
MGSDGLNFTPGSVSAPQMTGPSLSNPYFSGPQMNINTPTFQPGMPSMPQAPSGFGGGMPEGMPQSAPAPNNKMIFIALGVLLLVAIVVVVIFAMKK